MEPRHNRWRIGFYILAAFALAFGALLVYVGLNRHAIEERMRLLVVQELTRRFKTPVDLESLHLKLGPTVEVQGKNLSLRNGDHTDVPPLIHIEAFSFHLGALGILRAPSHIGKVTLQQMVITIPPGGGKKGPAVLGTMLPGGKLGVVIDEIVCADTDLIILPKKAGKEPLDFDIHNLVLKDVILDRPFSFWGQLTNAKPKGEIATQGQFGPWDAEVPGNSPVSGAYEFTNADLDPFPGIGGTLSSKGKYDGRLNHIDVEGVTDTPNFSLDPVGRGVPLHTDFSATVDGTDGDTYLHPVRAILGRSVITAKGSVVRVPNKGHFITLDVVAPDAHLEDILRLAMKSEKPAMTGVTNLKTRLLITPGTVKVLDRLQLNGDFSVKDATFSSRDVREKLESLSRHALGKPSNEEAGSAISDMRGHFQLAQSVITFENLVFSIEGAKVLLDGNYAIREQNLDFSGELRLQAKLSQLTTGVKSLLLKPVDPFYEKKGAGAVIPISITGTRDAPTIGVRVFHKTIKKQLAVKTEKTPGTAN